MDLAPGPRCCIKHRFTEGPRHEITERSVGLLRTWMAVGVVVLVCLDPPWSDFSRSTAVSYLFGFTVYSLLILLLLSKRPQCSAILRLVLHGADLVWFAVLPLLAHEPRAAYFLLLFVLAAAAKRWGLSGALRTVGVAAALVVGASQLLSSATPAADFVGTLRSTRSYDVTLATFALFVGGLLGFLVQKEAQQRWEASTRAAQSERARIMRELHDSTIQVLYTVECHLERLRRTHLNAPASMSKNLDMAQRLLRRSTIELREFVQQGRPLELGSKGFLGYIAFLVEEFRLETGITAQFVSECDRVSLSPTMAHELVRIVQEALMNVRKHSGAHSVLIRFSSEKGFWKFVIDDDGRGFDFNGRLCLSELEATLRGPAVLRERVCTLGGELTVESTPGRGARLEIALPKVACG